MHLLFLLSDSVPALRGLSNNSTYKVTLEKNIICLEDWYCITMVTGSIDTVSMKLLISINYSICVIGIGNAYR